MKKGVSILMAATMLASAPLSVIVNAQSKVDSVIKGNDRYETSVKVSQKAFKQSDYVIIASGENFPDALSGSVLSGYLKAPILLTNRKSLSDSVKSEIKRLNPKKVYILGGENMISKSIESWLKKDREVSRVSGKDRYETSKLIASELSKLGIGKNIAIASGKNFSDALSAAPALSQKNIPVVLVDPNKPLDLDQSKIKYIIGGKNSISYDVPGAKRIAGKDRYETSLKVSEEFNKGSKSFILASGQKYQDVLSTSVLSVLTSSPILLTEKDKIPESISKFLNNGDYKITIVGGENTISPSIISSQGSEKINTSVSSSRGSSSSHHSSPSHSEHKLTLAEKKAETLKNLEALEDSFQKLNNKELVIENVPENMTPSQAFDMKKSEVLKKIEAFKNELKNQNTSEDRYNEITKELSAHHGIAASQFILKPYTVSNTDSSNLVTENAVTASPILNDENIKPTLEVPAPRFARMKHDENGVYKFRIVTEHKGYLLNTPENRKKSGKVIAFNYVTKEGYTNLDKKKNFTPEQVVALKKNDDSLDNKVNIDVVSNPTPRYGRISLTEKTDTNQSDIKVTPVSNGYDVEIRNLPKDTVIVKPIFLSDLPLHNTFEYGDMIFIDRSQDMYRILDLAKKDIDDVNQNYKNVVMGESTESVDDILSSISNEINTMKNALDNNAIPSNINKKHGLVASELILKGYTVEDAGENLVTPNAVKSKKDNSETPRFARMRHNDKNEYVFKINSPHEGYVLNSSENKDSHKKLIGFTYVTKDDYNNTNKNSESNTVLSETTKNVDVVSNPTPRYKRSNLVTKADIEITDEGNGQYKVKIKNLPENTLIVKPIFLAKLPSGNSLEHGDMIFIDQNN